MRKPVCKEVQPLYRILEARLCHRVRLTQPYLLVNRQPRQRTRLRITTAELVKPLDTAVETAVKEFVLRLTRSEQLTGTQPVLKVTETKEEPDVRHRRLEHLRDATLRLYRLMPIRTQLLRSVTQPLEERREVEVP